MDLTEANLRWADLRWADLRGANLSRANLLQAKLRGADLSGADLSAALLGRTRLIDALLREANLGGALIFNADLSGADLSWAGVVGARLSNANLSDADLRFARGLVLDSNFERLAHFSAYANDPWSILRRTYTGPRLLFNLLFLVSFAIPYFMKLLFWASVNRAQAYTEAVVGEQAIALGLTSETVTNFARCLAQKCDALPAWKLILGFDKGWPFWTLAVALIFYNVLKAGLTWMVAPMRDEGERSGYCPAWTGISWWQGYRPLFWGHRVVSVMFWFAAAALAYNAWHWLSRVVWIPV